MISRIYQRFFATLNALDRGVGSSTRRSDGAVESSRVEQNKHGIIRIRIYQYIRRKLSLDAHKPYTAIVLYVLTAIGERLCEDAAPAKKPTSLFAILQAVVYRFLFLRNCAAKKKAVRGVLPF